MNEQSGRPHPLRTIARWLSRLILKIFFRRIEVIEKHTPSANQPTIFVLNHPNGLLDPLFILAFGPDNVSFMAKEPLFRTPVIRHFVTAFDCLPVYRVQDGADPKQNIKTMQAARDLLARGGCLALFPEGTTHDEPQLQPLKTGAARIALSSQAMITREASSDASVTLLPVGLHYPVKSTFRSDAVVVHGPALEVPQVSIDENAEPPRDAVSALTTQIDTALRNLTVNADDAEQIMLAATAARLLYASGAADTQAHGTPIHKRLLLMQRILARYSEIKDDSTAELQALITGLRNFQSLAQSQGVKASTPNQVDLAQATQHLAWTILGMAVGLPLILIGVVENYLAYRIVGHIAHSKSRGSEEVVSTLKVLGGSLLFPLTWLAISLVLLLNLGWLWAIAHLLAAPICAYAALWFADRAETTIAGTRAIWMSWFRKDSHAQLLAERDALVEQLLAQSPPRD